MDYEKTPGGIWRQCGDLQPMGIQNPAAGANLSITLGTGGIFRFITLIFGLTTSATVANRVTTIVFTHGGVAIFRVQSPTLRTASTAGQMIVSNFGTFAAGGNSDLHIPTPKDFFVPGQTVITTDIVNIQAGDVITGVTLYVEFFPGAGEY